MDLGRLKHECNVNIVQHKFFYAVILYFTIYSLLTRSLASKESERFPFFFRVVCVAERRRKNVSY